MTATSLLLINGNAPGRSGSRHVELLWCSASRELISALSGVSRCVLLSSWLLGQAKSTVQDSAYSLYEVITILVLRRTIRTLHNWLCMCCLSGLEVQRPRCRIHTHILMSIHPALFLSSSFGAVLALYEWVCYDTQHDLCQSIKQHSQPLSFVAHSFSSHLHHINGVVSL